MKKAKIAIAALSVAGALGVAAMPLASYAATNANGEITVHVGSNLSISLDASSSTSVNMDAGAFINGNSSDKRIQHKLIVNSNSYTGYKLTIEDSDSNTALTSTNSSIPSVTADDTKLVEGTAGWGWQVVETAEAEATDSWKKIPAKDSPVTFFTGSAATTAQTNQTHFVRFGVATATNQVSGDYTDTVIYTVLANDPQL